MMRRTTRGSTWAYWFWSPLYDQLIGLSPFRVGRAIVHHRLAIEAGERVLLVGVGTGVDLPLLPAGIETVGVDLIPAMLARAESRLPIEGRQIELLEADVQKYRLPHIRCGSACTDPECRTGRCSVSSGDT